MMAEGPSGSPSLDIPWVASDVGCPTAGTSPRGTPNRVRIVGARARIGMVVLILSAAIWACTDLSPPEPPQTSAPEQPSGNLPLPGTGEPGELQVFLTGQMSDGRNIQLRGLIRNPYSEAAEGVQVRLQILSRPGADASELDHFQKVMDVRIGPGERTALRWDVQTMYAQGGGGLHLAAFAMKLGGKMMPLPEAEKGK
jgi:hypothetical protein